MDFNELKRTDLEYVLGFKVHCLRNKPKVLELRVSCDGVENGRNAN
jgi:hypothetical protein